MPKSQFPVTRIAALSFALFAIVGFAAQSTPSSQAPAAQTSPPPPPPPPTTLTASGTDAVPAVNPHVAGGLALPTTSAGATYVGAEACSHCHYDKYTSYMNQPHSQSGDKRTPASRYGCESCHGPASNHVKGGGGRGVGGLMTFSKEPVAQRNAVCLQCHTRGNQALWHGSTHDQRKLACMDCHAIHAGHPKLLAQPSQQQLCTKCHQQIRQALMKPSHHPLREEKMQCTNCHNPHGTQTQRLISANSINDKCYECHAEKRGPFLWEHPPVRENCLNCHDPHGSSHEPLLIVKKPLLCQRCHSNQFHPSTLYAKTPAQAAAGTSVYAMQPQLLYRGCTNCHVQIHGSNSPSGKFWHR